MVKQLIALKTKMSWNALKSHTPSLILSIFAVIGFLQVMSFTYVAVIGFAVFGEPEYLALVTTCVGAASVLLWIVVPLVASGMDQTLDPRALATILPPSPRLAAALIATTGCGAAGIGTVCILLSIPIGFTVAKLPVVGLVALLMLAVSSVTAWTWSRMITTAVSVALDANSRLKDAALTIGAFVFIAIVTPLGVWIPLITENFSLEWLQGVVDVVSWLPFIAPWGVVWSTYYGAYGAAAAQFLIAIATVVVGGWLWLRVLPYAMAGTRNALPAHLDEALADGRHLVDPSKGHDGKQAAAGREARAATRATPRFLAGVDAWMRIGLPAPAASLATRTARDWVKDPRLIGNLAVIPLFSFMAIMFPHLGEGAPTFMGPVLLYIIPVLLGAIGGALPSYDSTAFWILTSSGITGKHERLGRLAGTLLIHVPLTAVICAVTGFFLGFSLVEAVAFTLFILCLYVTVLTLGLTLSSVWVYPVQPPGSSALASKGTGGSMITMLVSLGGQLGGILLSLPSLIVYILAWNGWGVPLWVSIVVCAVWSVIILSVTPFIAGRLWDQHNVSVLTQIRSWPDH